MKYFWIILVLIGTCGKDLYAADTLSDSLHHEVLKMSGKFLNYNCIVNHDSVFSLCSAAEQQAAEHQDYPAKFQAIQLTINIHCLQGDITLGINTAQRMYEEAKQQNNQLGMALAVQAIGAAYMHADLYQQANETFSEAEVLMEQSKNPLSRLRLTIQQLHTCMKLNDTTGMSHYISIAQPFLEEIDPDFLPEYDFYLTCYKTILLIERNQPEQALQGIQKMIVTEPDGGFCTRWHHYVKYRYYKQEENYETALKYCDSIMYIILQQQNMQEYKNSMMHKASLLETMNRYDETCGIYERINDLTDSLNMHQYTNQINVVHLTYWVDQMILENARARNNLSKNILYYFVIVIFIIVFFFFIAKRKNKQLILSREKLAAMREAAADSIQSKSMFLSNMSHDLRTPLNAIVGFSQILTDMEDVDAELKQQCRDNIKQNSDLLLKLINDIVDFSSLKDAKIKFEFEQCNVVALCQNVIETVERVKQTAAVLYFSTDLTTLELETDSGRLQQVLINLLVNATKFTKAGYIRLSLKLDEQNNEALFIIEDTGCGIALEKQVRIFERFEKLHDAVQGVGLGLSICKLIIEHVNGRIWIDSGYTAGARFVFTHPIRHKYKN